MLGPADYLLWFIGVVLEAAVVVYSLLKRQFLRYITLNLYMLAAAGISILNFTILQSYGYSSVEYYYVYYYGDTLLTVLLFFCVIQLYQHVFEELKASKYIRGASLLLLLGTAWATFLMVWQSESHLTGRFVVELSRNLYFVGLVLTYVLWGAVMKLRETRARIIQFLLALGVYFSAYSATYALRGLFPNLMFTKSWLPPMVGLWLPLAWSYTMWRVPEEARLATARVAATHTR